MLTSQPYWKFRCAPNLALRLRTQLPPKFTTHLKEAQFAGVLALCRFSNITTSCIPHWLTSGPLSERLCCDLHLAASDQALWTCMSQFNICSTNHHFLAPEIGHPCQVPWSMRLSLASYTAFDSLLLRTLFSHIVVCSLSSLSVLFFFI